MVNAVSFTDHIISYIMSYYVTSQSGGRENTLPFAAVTDHKHLLIPMRITAIPYTKIGASVDLPSTRSSGIYSRVIFLWILYMLIPKFILFKWQSHPQGSISQKGDWPRLNPFMALLSPGMDCRFSTLYQCQKWRQICTGPTSMLSLSFIVISDDHMSSVRNKTIFTKCCLTQWTSKLARSLEIH